MLGNSLFSALRIVMLIPFLGAMGYGLLMTKFSQEMQSGEPGFASNLLAKVGMSYLNGMMADKKAAVVDTAGLSDDRQVRFSKTFAAGSFGLDAATMSEAEMEIRLFGQAKLLADAECKDILQGFAKSCRPDSIRVDVHDSGTYSVGYSLSFAAVADPGDLSNADGRALRSTKVKLTDEYRDAVPEAELAAYKGKLFAEAEAQCALLRVTMGNCMVTNVYVDEELPEDGKVMIRADAQLSALGPVGEGNPEELALNGGGEAGGLMGLLGAALKTEKAAPDPSNMGEAVNDIFKQTADALKAADAGQLGTENDGAKRISAPEAGSLIDGADEPRFKDTKSRAKFVTAPEDAPVTADDGVDPLTSP